MPEREKLPGSKLSISGIEQQMPRYKIYQETGEIRAPEINILTQEETEQLEANALLSFRGTQIHNLIYILQLYNRCQKLNRVPTFQDLRDTYPTASIDESKAMALLYEQNPDDPIEVWKQWIENCEVPTKKNLTTALYPETIMGIWLSGTENPDIEDVVNNLEESSLDQIEMNELFSVLNLKFLVEPDFERNLQIPSFADTVLVSSEETEQPITVIDYKSKDLSDIQFLEKIQALLISTSIYYNIIDFVPKATWRLSQWDVTHSSKEIELPHFRKRPMFKPLELNCSIYDDLLKSDLSLISKKVRFVLKNPMTNETRDVDFSSVKKNGLDYLRRLNEFYAENKQRLKSNKNYSFLTPQLVPEKVINRTNYEKYKEYKGTQVSLF